MISNINNSIKPNIKPMVPWFLDLFELHSGINSSITTIIIVPAANESIKGRRETILFAKIIPSIPPNGSSNPGMDPITNDFSVEILSFFNGMEREKPSGKFCSTIAIDKVIAPARLPVRFWELLKEKAIPIEIPSIILRSAEDKIIRDFFFRDMDIGRLFFKIIHDINLSVNLNDKAPKMKPKVMENKLVSLLSDNSVAGMSNDQIEDEIIIPAVKPKNIL